MTKYMDRVTLERETQRALSAFPSAVKRVQAAAEESLEAAKGARAHARRERISTQSSSKLERVRLAEDEKLEMPEDWRDDETTRKITLPPKE